MESSSVTVFVPSALQKYTANKPMITIEASNTLEMIDRLEEQCAGIKKHLLSKTGQLHRFINIYINSDNVQDLQGLSTCLRDGDEVTIVQAVAGG